MQVSHTSGGETARQGDGRPLSQGKRGLASLALCTLVLLPVVGCSSDLSQQDGKDAKAGVQAQGRIDPDWAAPILSMQSSSLDRVATEWVQSECTGAAVAAAETRCAGIATRDAMLANQTLDRVNELLAKDQPVETLLPIAEEAHEATKNFFAHFCDRETAKPDCVEATEEILDVLARYKAEADRLLA